MASIAKLSCAGVAIVILFANLYGVFSTSLPASPAVLPFAKNINAPNMSSFFPNSSSNSEAASPNAEVPSSSSDSQAASPNAEVPSSGEFVGKVSSANSNRAAAGLCCFMFVFKFV